MNLSRMSALAVSAAAFAAALTGCSVSGAIRGDSVKNELVVSDPAALIALVENPGRLAIFPLTNRTSQPALGVIAEEVLLGEITRNYIWDGALVSEVRDALLTAGYKWFDTADATAARQLAGKIGASAYLIGSVDDYINEGTVSLAGTVQLRSVETDRLILFGVFSTEDNSLYRDKIDPRELLRRALAALFERVANDVDPQLEVYISERRREIREEMAGLKSGPFHRLDDDEKSRFSDATDFVDDSSDLPNHFLEVRRLASARSTVRNLLVQARYRERLAALRAMATP